jgi:hypothetical protein
VYVVEADEGVQKKCSNVGILLRAAANTVGTTMFKEDQV